MIKESQLPPLTEPQLDVLRRFAWLDAGISELRRALNGVFEFHLELKPVGGAFYRQCRMSAQGIPQISAVFGECTAGGAYIPALSDEVVMTAGNSSVHLGGPQIVKAAIKEIVDRETLGGAEMHSTVSGVSDHFARDEAEAISKPRDIVGALIRVQKIHG